MIFEEGTIVEGEYKGEKVIGAVVSAKELQLDESKTEIFRVIFQNDMTNTAVYGTGMPNWGFNMKKAERFTHLIVGKHCPGEVKPV
ncbi:MAG: hypothetical protein HOJ16_01810 [Candidatus Peribacter sp.]|jgi:hypothetical protein|nr:hypothetical protein [Candidatus Peribacter sp.]